MFYQWRKLMGSSYQDMLETPIKVIYEDLDFASIEDQVRVMKENKPRNVKSK